MVFEQVLSVFLGIGLAASVGFRIFVPLLVLSLASFFNFWELNESWQWIGSTTALITLTVATVAEIFAYYIPIVDNLLDTIAVPLAAVAGTAAMASTMIDITPVVSWSLAIIAGGGTAAAIASTSSISRLASTTTTAGLANPIVSTIETFIAFALSIISVFIPILAVIIVIIILVVIYRLYRKMKSRR